MFTLKPYICTWEMAILWYCHPSVAPKPHSYLPWLLSYLSFSLLSTVCVVFCLSSLSSFYCLSSVTPVHGPVTASCSTWWVPQRLLCLVECLRMKGSYPSKPFNQLFVPLKEDADIYYEQVLLLSRSAWRSSALSIIPLIILNHNNFVGLSFS